MFFKSLRPWLWIALLPGVPALAGCAPDVEVTSRGVDEETVVVGSWAPLTGPAAAWGAVGRGIETYFKMVNEEGGIHGRRIRFLLRDDAYQPARTVAVTKEMVERDGVFAFVGGVGTAPGMAVKDYLVRRDVPWISPATGSHHWAYPPNRLIFATLPLYVHEVAVLVDYAVRELGKKRIGVFYLNDDYGKSGLAGARLALEKHGLRPVAETSCELMDTDLATQALQLRESGADVVLLWVVPRHAAILLGEAAKLGFQPQWMASFTLSDVELMHELTGGLWEETIFASALEPAQSNPLMAKYRLAREKFAPEERGGVFFYAGFSMAEPLVEGLRRAGPELTVEGFIQALESLEGFKGVGPELTFGPERRQGGRSVYLARCLTARDVELLTDWVEPDIDVQEAIRRLDRREGSYPEPGPGSPRSAAPL